MRLLTSCVPIVSTTAVAFAAAVLGLCGCTEAGLQPRQKQTQTYDDELRVEGQVCASLADDTLFPVKILFVVDTSDSMNVTDPGAVRAKAVSDVLKRFAGNPVVQFGVIAFDAKVEAITKGFTNTPDIGKISARLSMADRLTDYQGALGAAYSMLSEDMLKSSPADRARTKYVVIFFSDGAPDPQCSARETPCGTGTCPAKQHCRAGQCSPDYLICQVPKADWASAFNPPLDPALYPDLDAGADYNQSSQILRSVDDIAALQQFYRVGEVRLHTGFLFDKAAAANPLAGPFGLDREGGIDLLTRMSERGTGSFTEFDSASKINFLNVNYTSIKQENALAALIATNINAAVTDQGVVSDTDGDGLPDSTEAGTTCVGTGGACANGADTDGDGYSDLLEVRNQASGFDAKDPNKPFTKCQAREDSDGDGLRDCEEAFLRLDPRLPDSDGDRLPDGLEVSVGLDPTDAKDALQDPDLDGIRNLDEVKTHQDPFKADRPENNDGRYFYEVASQKADDGRSCYQMQIRHIHLLTTGRGTESPLGRNRVLLYFNEAPVDRALDFGALKVACVDARYIDGLLKSPPNGVVSVTDKDFVPVANFNPDKDCRDLTNVGAGNAKPKP